jgi:hypothetical protein
MGEYLNETQKIEHQENNTEVITAYTRVPYALINAESTMADETISEFAKIIKLYKVYNHGSKFISEGTGGDYIPANLRSKKAAKLINKEARFLFGETPDITISPKGDVGTQSDIEKENLVTLQDLVNTVLTKNMFDNMLIKAAKDCFIGKRVAGLVNFNETDGITITFLSSLNFIYETKLGNSNILSKFVCFEIIRDTIKLADKRIFKKKYVLETKENGKEVCYLEETLYDGTGALIEIVTEYQPTLLDRIPVAIFLNDGLLGNIQGESEIEDLDYQEQWYNKLSNADIDCERKTMNPIRYTVDMDSKSTKNLSSAPGSYWDLVSDQSLDQPSPQVNMLQSNLAYSTALQVTMSNINSNMHDAVDVPDINLETMKSVITSGKALKSIYWPLIVRCKEKMKMWGPQLKYLIDIIITGSYAYPDIAQRYISDKLQDVKYEIEIESNYPLPEDETEEKQNDLAEVTAQTMSRKSYMKKWRKLTDSESDEELQQIAVENELLNNSFSNSFNQDQTGTDNQDNTDNQNDVNNSNQDNVNNNIKDELQQ